jgi:hypothetical protein
MQILIRSLLLLGLLTLGLYFALVYRATVAWYDERLSEQARELALLSLAFRRFEGVA